MSTKSIKPLTGNFGDFSGIVLKAAARGDLPAIKYYLKINPKWLNQVGPHGRTMLWEAAYKGRTGAVQWLIEQGANVGAIGSYYTPMHVELSAMAAARHAGHDETAKLLSENGAKDDFWAACHRGDTIVMQTYIKRKPSIVNTPIYKAEPRPRMGFHPIHYAVVGGHRDTIGLLIEKGATVAEHLPLLLDWCEINRSMVLPVLKKQAEIESPGSTKARRSKSTIPIIDQPGWLGYPPLVDACRGNHNATDDPSRVQQILKQGADINIRDYKEKTPLHRASQAGFIKITKLLVTNGAELEAADNKLETPIFDAAGYGRGNTVELLIKFGVNIEHENYRGDTPLFAAARKKRTTVFELLLQYNANHRHQNSKGQTVSDILSRARHLVPERVEMLRLLNKLKARKIRKKK